MTKSKRIAKPQEFHGETRDGRRNPLYNIWSLIKRRCRNPTNPSYVWYGARGIEICDRWAESFATFLEDVGPRPGPNYTLDRIDNDGHYEPGNVRWVTQAINQRHTRRSKLTAEDVKLIRKLYTKGGSAELVKRFGISKVMICRIARGEAWKD